MSAAETILSPEAVTGAHGSSLQRLVGRHSWALLINADCRDVTEQLQADAIISDPPYGMEWVAGTVTKGKNSTGGSYTRHEGATVMHDDSKFDPSPWLEYPRVVLFGANHYAQRLPVGTTLVWVKRFEEAFGTFLSDGEVAWMKGGHGVYCKRDTSDRSESRLGERLHPTQKPVSLMAWCIEKAKVPEGGTVCDPYMGSGSTGVACVRLHRNFIGVEKDKRHFDNACDRIRRELEGALL